jgi:hypothetical protein
MLQLKLKRFMRQHKVTQVALSNVISDLLLEWKKSVTERHVRYIVNNVNPLTPKNTQRKPSLIVLGFIIKGLRDLTGQNVSVSDVLEYHTLVPETQTPVVELLSKEDNHEENELPTDGLELVPIVSDVENERMLDEVWELTVHTLEQRGHPELSRIVATFNEPSQEANFPEESTRKRWANKLPILLTTLLLLSIGYITLDYFILKPQLLAGSSRLSLFSDRVRPTSSLSVPSLIGPEGDVEQLSPTLRVSPVRGALGYEFYLEDTVSDVGVYSGSINSTSFVIPEDTLCPNTTYTWRARTLGKDGWTSFSSPLEFTISSTAVAPEQQNLLKLAMIKQAPEVPEIVAPIGTTNTTMPTLEVSPMPNIYGYGFYIRDLESDGLVYDNNFVTSHSVTIPDGVLKDGGVYQWNTRSRNCHYWSEFTESQVFTVNVHEPTP